MTFIKRTPFPYGFYATTYFDYHQELKQKLLDEFQKINDISDVSIDHYYSDNVNKVDWKDGTNFERPWVKLLYKPLFEHVTKIQQDMGYNRTKIDELWFQQYVKDNSHGWHTHGSNFTAVYYVELDKSSPVTQIAVPWTGKIIDAEIREGDIIYFPSHIIHRAPIIHNDVRKTIVSFNFTMVNPNEQMIEKMR